MFTKYGLDVQEDQLKAMASPSGMFEAGFGMEPESTWGVLENISENGVITKSTWPSDAPGEYVSLFKNLAGVIRNGEEQAVKWEEATQVIEMIEWSYKSSREGITVDIPTI